MLSATGHLNQCAPSERVSYKWRKLYFLTLLPSTEWKKIFPLNFEAGFDLHNLLEKKS